MYEAAAAIAGAVLRPKGSNIKLVLMFSLLILSYSSRILDSSLELHIVKISLPWQSEEALRNAFCRRLWSSSSLINGLGRSDLDMGHSREPAPPQSIVGITLALWDEHG